MNQQPVEIWKEIPSCPGYEASNLGRIRSSFVRKDTAQRQREILKLHEQGMNQHQIAAKLGIGQGTVCRRLQAARSTREPRVLHPTPCRLRGKGHLVVNVHQGGRKRLCSVHRLVLEAFVGPCPEGMECRHYNDVPGDNRIENLCWGTRRENHEDMDRNGLRLRGNKCSWAKLTEERVREIRTRRAAGESVKSLTVEYGTSQASMSRICNGTDWRHAGGPLTKRKIGPKSRKQAKVP